MCDMRPPPNRVLFKETHEIRDLPLQGYYVSITDIPTDKLQFGLYHIGASGCGYAFYDGQNWSNLDSYISVDLWGSSRTIQIESETEKYKFLRPPRIYDYEIPLS